MCKKTVAFRGLRNPGFKLSALALAVQLASGSALAGPEGGVVKGGSGSISTNGTTTTIEQLSNRMAIDWQSYDVNASERVQYIQPSSSSISLNRILSNSGSQIHGQIDANGHVILMNPHGVVFGAGATVNVGGLLATGLNIEADAFMNGNFALSALEDGEGKVINSGIINAASGGSVTLLGEQVENNGLIVANLGRVNLAAGKEAVVTFDGDGLMGVRITEEILQEDIGVDAAVVNSGDIVANGGQILLTASVSQDIFSQAVNTNGEAKSVVVHDDGSFTLGGGANVVNSGTLSTSGSSQGNGQVVVLGENITHSGVVEAEGGDIELHAQDTLLLTEQAEVNARNSESGVGGTVKLLGDRVGLFDSASVNASGLTGGGAIYVGGDYRGANPWLPTAERILVSADAVLQASAILTGDGGIIINWADSANWFYGSAYAEGGAFAGNGGFIEISAPSLDYGGTASVFASSGLSGQILFDPLNVIFGIGSDDNGQLSDGAILSGDSPGSTLTLNSSAFNGLSGDLIIEATNNISFASNFQLALTENTNITSLTFTADQDNSGAGDFTMDTGSYLHSSGVPVYISGFNVSLTDVTTGWVGDNTTNTTLIGRNSNLTVVAANDLTATTILNADGWGVDSGVPADSGGDVSLIAGGNISIAGVTAIGSTAASAGFSGGEGGTVFIQAGGNVSIGADGINTSGGNPNSSSEASGADAGDVYIGASSGTGTITLVGDIWVGGGRRWASDGDNTSIINGAAGDVVINGNALINDTDFTIDSRYSFDYMFGDHPDVHTAPNSGNIIFTGTLDANNNDAQVTLFGNHVSIGGNVGAQTSGSDPVGQLGNFAIHATGNVAIGEGASGNPVVLTEQITIASGVSGVSDFSINSSETTLTTVGSVRAASFTVDDSLTFFTVGGKGGDGVDDSVTIGDALSFQSGDIVTSLGDDLDGGDVYIGATGAVVVGAVNTQGGTSSGAGEGTYGRNGGSVTIAGDSIAVGAIDTSGSDGNDTDSAYFDEWDGGAGGDVSLVSTTGDIFVTSVTTDGGNGDAVSASNSNNNQHADASGGSAGDISIISASGSGSLYLGGDLSLRGGRLFEYDESVTPSEINGEVGTLTLTGNDIVLTDDLTISLNMRDVPSGSGSSDTTSNNFSFSGAINSEASEENDLSIIANQITFGGNLGSTQRLGAIDLDATADISASTNAIVANSLDALTTGFFNSGSITTAGAEASQGGNVVISADTSVSTAAINTSSGDSTKGDVDIDSNGAIVTGAITTAGTGESGNSIDILSTADSVTTGAIDTSAGVQAADGQNGFSGGSVSLRGTNVSTGAITTDGTPVNNIGGGDGVNGGNGGNITITAESADSNYSITIAGDISATPGAGDAAGSDGTVGTLQLNLTDTDTNSTNIGTIYLGTNDTHVEGGAGNLVLTSFPNVLFDINGSAGSDSLIGPNFSADSGIVTEWGVNSGAGGASTITEQGSVAQGDITGIESFYARDGENNFIVAGSGNTTYLVGGADSTVTGPDDANYWFITANGTGALSESDNAASAFISFGGMDAVTGGSDVDDFNIASGVTSLALDGADGNDIFELSNGEDNTWTINESATSDVWWGADTDNRTGEIVFADIETFIGGSGADAFVVQNFAEADAHNLSFDGEGGSNLLEVAIDEAQTWTLDGTDTVSWVTGESPDPVINWSIDFSDIQSVTGGGAGDTFTVTAANVTAIDGAAGADAYNIGNINGVSVSDSGADSAQDELTLTHAFDADWSVNGSNTAQWNEGAADNSVSFSGVESLVGGSGADDFNVSSATAVNAIAAGNGTNTFTLSADITSLTITGGSDSDTLTLGHTLNTTWLFDSDDATPDVSWNSGTDRTVFFSNVNSIAASGGADTFNVNAAIAFNIDGRGGDDDFNLSASSSGTLAGGAGNDDFFLNTESLSYAITGGDDTDSVQIYFTADVTWTIDGGSNELAAWNDSGDTARSATLTTIESLIGSNTGSDIFNINTVTAPVVTSVNGHGGSNSVVSLQSSGGSNAWDLASETSGNYEYYTQAAPADSDTPVFVIGFTNIGSLAGSGALNDVLTGTNTGSTWRITDENTGSYRYTSSPADDAISFSNIDALQGGDAADSFVFDYTDADNYGSITSLDGGAGADTLNAISVAGVNNAWQVTGVGAGSIAVVTTPASPAYVVYSDIENLVGGVGTDYLDLSGYAGDIAVSVGALTETADITNDFEISAVGFEGAIGNDSNGTGIYRSLLIVNDAATTESTRWSIIDVNDGSVEGLDAGDNTLSSFSFDGFNTLWGDAEADAFAIGANIDSSIVGRESEISGLGGADTFSVNAGVTLAANILGGDGADVFSIDGTTTGNLQGGAGNDRFNIASTARVSQITGGDDIDTLVSPTGTGGSEFALAAGNNSLSDGVDTSPVVYVADFSGVEVLEGSGSDTLNATAYTANLAVDFDISSASAMVFGLSGFRALQANSDNTVTNTLYGGDVENTWSITGVNTGTVAGVSFENFSNLVGGTNNDTFTLAGGSVLGSINGGGFQSDGEDVIQGVNADAWWYITADNAGFVNGASVSNSVTTGDVVSSFTAISGLAGGTADDTFVVRAGSIASATGGLGQDTLSYEQATGPVLVTLSSASGDGSFSGIEQYRGNNTNSTIAIADSVGGTGATATWNITNENDGNVEFTGISEAILFEDFNNITGGNNTDDTFTLAADGRVTGTLSGGTGGTDTISGPNAGSYFVVSDTENYVQVLGNASDRRVQDFSNIETLTGGTVSDTFDIASNFSGAVNGGAGANELLVTSGSGNDVDWFISGENSGFAASITFTGMQTLTGGAGNDTFTLGTGGSVTTLVDGGAGANGITGPAAASRFVISTAAQYVEEISDPAVDPEARRIQAFQNISAFTGGAGDDEFVIAQGQIAGAVFNGAGGSNSIAVNSATNTDVAWVVNSANGGLVDSNTFSNMQALAGGDGSDTFRVTTAAAGVGITGGSQNADDNGDTLWLDHSSASTWTVNGTSNAVGSVTFAEIETLQGSSAADTFNVSENAVERIDGRAGNDTFNIENTLVAMHFIGGSNTGGNGDILALTHGDSALWVVPNSDSSENTVVSGTGANEGTSTFTGIETARGSDGGVDTFNISDSSVALYEGRGGDDIFTVSSSTVAATLVGGGDTVSVGDTLTLQHSTTTSWNITGGTTHTAGSLSFSDIEVAEGSNGVDTFTIASSDVAQLYGRGGNDFFEISSADVTVEIIGGSHATNGADEIDLSHSSEAEWHLTGDTVETVVANPDSPTGTVSFSGVEIAHGSQGSDVFQVASSNLTTIYGDAGGDTFNVALNFGPAIFGDSKSGAAAGTDVLVLNHSTDVNWTIDADPSVSNGSTTLNFSGIETARGSAGNDQFTVTAASVNLLEGGSGADTFIINQSGLAFAINGRGVAATDATDTLTLGNSYTENSSWVLTDSASTLGVTSGSGAQVSFQNIDTVNGGSGNDTYDIRGSAVTSIFGFGGNDSFTLENAGISGVLLNGGVGTNSLAVDHTETTLWTIDTALNGGNTINVTGTTDVEFSNVSELYGAQFDAGGGIDTFHINTEFTGDIDSRSGADVININAAVSGTIDGGTGGDTFNVFASVNNGISDSFDILGGNGADIFWLQSNSVETRISGGLSDADTLHGYTTDTTWTIDSTSTVATGSVSSSFIAIENLVGRNAVADTFVLLDGSPLSSLDINAGAADGVVDSLDFSNYSLVNNRLDITSSLVSDLVINIERVIGNNTQGLAATSTTGSTVNWILQDIDGSGSAENEGSVGAFQFIGFNSLYGGDGNDLFTFNGGTLTGNIDGSGGTNTVARAADTGDTTWSITDTNIGRLTGLTGEFSNIDVLSGNNNNDTFVFIDTTTGGPSQFGSWSGQIIGGDGLGVDVITSNKLQASNWNISGSGAGSVDGWLTAYSGIEQLNGAQEYVDTFTVTDGGRMLSINGGTDAGETINDILNADNSALVNTWLIDRDNGGSLSSGEDPSLTPMIDSFDSIETLIGASGKDIFIAQDVVSLRGTIYGENPAGHAAETNNLTDTLDLTGFTGRIVVVVGSGETGEDQGDGFTKVSVEITETDPNNTSQVRELRGTASTTVWQITGLNEITIPGEDEPYTGFQYLVGHGNASDSFEFAVNGALTGGITGGTGTGTDTIVGFGHALETPWNITATGSGTSTINSEVFTFSQIENIVGGSGSDAFTIESASNSTIALDINAGNGANRFDVNTPLSGSLTSGTGIDTLLINAPVTGIIDSGNGSDVFTIATSLESMTLIAGGGSNDVLTIDYDAAATWMLDGTTGWTVSDDGLDGSISTLTISGFETFNGSNREDFVTFNDSSFGGVFSGRGGADQFSLATDAMTFTLHGEDGFSPSSANDSVTNTHTEDATWVLASDGSSVATSAGEVTLSGIDSVIGGSGRDDITVSVAMDSVNGGSGVDEISIGAAIANGVSGGEGADRIFVTADNLVFTVDGGSIDSEIDELMGFDTINTWQIRNVGTSSLLNGETGIITLMGFESLTGGSQQDTFEIGATLAGTVQGMGGGDIFRIAAGVLGDILGGTGDDQFTIEQNTFALAIDAGGGGNDTLIYSVANATTNQWLITNENEGSVSNEETITFEGVEIIEGSASSDYFTINDNISGEIRGSGGSNTYLFTNSGITTDVVGGINADTIQVDHTDGGLWTNISGTQEIVDGSATPGTITFSEVETFIAGNGEDVFNIGNATSRVETNGGNDWVTTSVSITNGVDLGEGNDTIQVTSANLSFEINGGDPNTANPSGGDTFIGYDAEAQWLVSGSNSGTYTNNNIDFITLTNIENLTGGDGNDTYTINSGAVLNGVIDGGGNTQQIANPNTPDFDNDIFGDEIIATALVGANTFVQEDTYSGGGHYSFANVERLSVTAQTGVGNYDTIQSGNGVNSWVINGSNRGILINEDTGATTYFTGFQNVQGGLGVDQFALMGNNSNYIDGQIHGGSGSAVDTIDYSLVDEAVTVQLGSESGGIADVEGVTGYREGTVGASHQRILIGVDGVNDSEISTWTISDFDGASVAADGINDGEFTRGGNTYQFTNFNTLIGHDNNDQFIISGTGRLTGGVIGGGGSNTLTASAMSGSFSVQVSNASVTDLSDVNPTDGIVQMSGVSTVVANGNFANTFYAANNTANVWQISAPDSGSLNGILFHNFGSLTGGNTQDTFTFTTATSLSGLIDGNGGSIDVVDATGLNDNQVVLVGTSIPDGVEPDLQIANVESILLDGSNNELVGDANNRTWALNGNNSGTLTLTGANTPDTSVMFSGFATLRGNSADDTFVVAGNNRLSGVVMGGNGDDSMDLSAITTSGDPLVVAVGSVAQSDADFTVSELENLIGSNSTESILRASNSENNWQITGVDTGTLNASLDFIDFASVVGGNNVDTFTFIAANGSEGELSGSLDGGSQPENTEDTVNMAALSVADVQLGGTDGMVNIERFVGNNTNSHFRSQNLGNSWLIDGENSGVLNDSVRFENFNYLYGGSDTDSFQVGSAGSVSGEVAAGAGADTLMLELTDTSNGMLIFNGGSESDEITLIGGSNALIAEFSPETLVSGESELKYSNDESNTEYSLLISSAEQIRDSATASRLIVNDTSGIDEITLNANSVVIDGFPLLYYSNKNSLEINASSNDEITVENTLSLSQQLSLRNATVHAGTNAQVDVNTLLLDSTGSVGSSTNRLSIDVTNLMIQSSSNPIYLQDNNQLNIAELTSSNIVDIVANGAITDSADLVMQGAESSLWLQSNTASVLLDNANAFGGSLSVVADEQVQINSTGRLSLSQLTAQNATLSAGGNIDAAGPVAVERALALEAAGNLVMTNDANQLGSVEIIRADNATIFDSDLLAIAEATVSGAFSTQSQGLLVNGAVVAESLNFNSGSAATTISGALSSNGNTLVEASGIDVLAAISGGSVVLDAGSGNVDQQAQISSLAGTLTITGNSISQNAELLSNSNIELLSNTGYQQNSAITATNAVNIQASGGSINMATNTLTNAASVNYTAANDMAIARINSSSLQLTAGGHVDVNTSITTASDSVIASRSFAMANNAEMSSAASLQLTTAANADLGSINAVESLSVSAGGNLTVNEALQSNVLVISGDGNVQIDANLTGIQGLDIASNSGDVNVRANLTASAGDVSISADGDLSMLQSASINVTGENTLTLSSGDNLSVANLSAESGDIVLNSGGEVVDQTDESTIFGNSLVINATSGVRGVDSDSAFNADVASLWLNNYQNSVTFTNESDISVSHLGNNGDVMLRVLEGDIVLDNTEDNTYVGGDDPLVAGGVSNANFNIGNLTLFALGGRIIATGDYINTQPDIVAENATLLASQYGTPARALVYYVQNNLNIDAELLAGVSYGSGFYRNIRPNNINDQSNRRPGMFDNYSNGGEQLVEVEELVEIDPAIFTAVSNYFFDEVSIRLPSDQLYEDELEELEELASID